MGGHDVSEPDIRRRYFRSARNFLSLYRLLADEWRIYDNTDLNPILAGSGAYDRITQVDVPFVWESIEQAARMS